MKVAFCCLRHNATENALLDTNRGLPENGRCSPKRYIQKRTKRQFLYTYLRIDSLQLTVISLQHRSLTNTSVTESFLHQIHVTSLQSIKLDSQQSDSRAKQLLYRNNSAVKRATKKVFVKVDIDTIKRSLTEANEPFSETSPPMCSRHLGFTRKSADHRYQ